MKRNRQVERLTKEAKTFLKGRVGGRRERNQTRKRVCDWGKKKRKRLSKSGKPLIISAQRSPSRNEEPRSCRKRWGECEGGKREKGNARRRTFGLEKRGHKKRSKVRKGKKNRQTKLGGGRC